MVCLYLPPIKDQSLGFFVTVFSSYYRNIKKSRPGLSDKLVQIMTQTFDITVIKRKRMMETPTKFDKSMHMKML